MLKATLICIGIMMLCPVSLAQKKKPTTKSPFTTSAKSPALPTEAGIKLHRMKDKVLYLEIKNNGTKPIKKVICSILIMDTVTLKIIQPFSLLTFEYAVAVSPQETFEAILDESKLPELKGDNITFGRCKDYQYAKDKNGEWDRTFAPIRCTQDAFVITISGVIFSDETTWLPQEFAKVINQSGKSKNNSKPTEFPQPSFKLSQLKQLKITKAEYGELWAFIPSEGILACNSDEELRLYFINGTNVYALNGWAMGSKVEGVTVSPNLKEVVGNEKAVSLFMNKAASLCK